MPDNATYQNSVQNSLKPVPTLFPFFGQVQTSYSDRMACDVVTWDGGILYNVPVLTKCGLNPSNQVWGEMELPQEGDYVLVFFVGPYITQPIILGTVFPFTNNYYQSNQTPVDSSNKQFTKQILQTNLPNTYRKVFKSGTTLEVQEDGSVIWETPSGSYLEIKESDGSITVDAHGSNFNINTGSGGTVNLNGTGDYVTKYTELNTQLQSLISVLQTHTHTSAASGSPTTPPLESFSTSFSSAQSSKVQVGG